MFITQLLNRASSMMWAAIQNKTKKQSKTKKKQTNKQTNKKPPAAMRHQHQMYMRFPHCTMEEMKKDKLAKD